MACVACPSISKWRLAVIIKRKAVHQGPTNQPEPPAHQLIVKQVAQVAQAHFYSYRHFWQTQTKHGLKFLGGVADDQMCIRIPRNPRTKKEEKIYIRFFLQQKTFNQIRLTFNIKCEIAHPNYTSVAFPAPSWLLEFDFFYQFFPSSVLH